MEGGSIESVLEILVTKVINGKKWFIENKRFHFSILVAVDFCNIYGQHLYEFSSGIA